MFYHVFCIDRKETINIIKKRTTHFFNPAFTLLISSSSLKLLNLLLSNLSFLLKDLQIVFAHVSIKANVFVQKNIHHILNYEQESMENCLF